MLYLEKKKKAPYSEKEKKGGLLSIFLSLSRRKGSFFHAGHKEEGGKRGRDDLMA